MPEQEEFNTLEKELALCTRAIAHPARVAIILAIIRNGNRIRGEVIHIPQLSQATVTQHLRELKRAGFVHGKIFGVKSEYSVDLSKFEKFSETFSTFLSQVFTSSPTNELKNS